MRSLTQCQYRRALLGVGVGIVEDMVDCCIVQAQARERMSESPSGCLPMPPTCVELVEMVCNFPVVTTDSRDSCNGVHTHTNFAAAQ